MSTNQVDIGLIGMGVMGYSLLQNLADRGFSVAGLDTDQAKVNQLQAAATGKPLVFTTHMEAFVGSLSSPKKVWLMVPAGGPVDSVIKQLTPLLEPGDIILDGGNSHFEDTHRRQKELAAKGIHFLGVGVSGGEEGARFGPSIMPGGESNAYEPIRPFLEAIAAVADGEPCVTYLGKGGAGHYVKMVHNGIEYGLMQLISECYDLMHRSMGMNNEEMAEVFERWNEGRLQSFLVEITRDILRKTDDLLPEKALIDSILDTAKQKGTGKWTSQSALDLGVPIPTIDVAVMFRYLSARKMQRVEAAKWKPEVRNNALVPKEQFLQELERVLFGAFILTYAQGFELLRLASKELGFGLDLAAISRIWRGGCIIRAALLNELVFAFSKEPNIHNVIFSESFRDTLLESRMAWSSVIGVGLFSQVAIPAISSGLSYLEAYFSERLPANMIQAQRDFFGAHTYQRLDQSGTFHTDWNEPNN